MIAVAAAAVVLACAVIWLAHTLVARSMDELAAERAAAAAERSQHAQVLLELVAAVQSPGGHLPMLVDSPTQRLNVSEADELAAAERGERLAVADAIQANLDAIAGHGIRTPEDELFALREAQERLDG